MSVRRKDCNSDADYERIRRFDESDPMETSKKYRRLEKGEIIREFDEYLDGNKGWVESGCIGFSAPDPRVTAYRQYRREVRDE